MARPELPLRKLSAELKRRHVYRAELGSRCPDSVYR
jgi:hypothetical protein